MSDRVRGPTRARWARVPSPEERAAELARDEHLTERDVRRALALTIVGCFVWLLVGLALIGWALHTMDVELGEIAFLGGLIVGYAGMATTLARYYLRGERSGWW